MVPRWLEMWHWYVPHFILWHVLHSSNHHFICSVVSSSQSPDSSIRVKRLERLSINLLPFYFPVWNLMGGRIWRDLQQRSPLHPRKEQPAAHSRSLPLSPGPWICTPSHRRSTRRPQLVLSCLGLSCPSYRLWFNSHMPRADFCCDEGEAWKRICLPLSLFWIFKLSGKKYKNLWGAGVTLAAGQHVCIYASQHIPA